jgi:hypothetical protein
MHTPARPQTAPTVAALASTLLSAAACRSDGPPLARAAAVDDVSSTQSEPLTLSQIASSARGFPEVWTVDGAHLADGSYARWPEGDVVRVALRHAFEDGRTVEEQASFAPGPPLEQRTWSWTESRGGRPVRHFEVDFTTGAASVERFEDDGDVERDEGEIDVEPGTTFAGFGFTLAIQSRRESLVEGAVAELKAVAFVLGVRTVDVEISHAGTERMLMGGRELTGDRFDIVPRIPALVDLVIDAPTSRIWLTRPPPTEFLRFEGPLVEPDDPRVRIDLLPGTESGTATPAPGP